MLSIMIEAAAGATVGFILVAAAILISCAR